MQLKSGQEQSPGPGLAYPPLLLRTFTLLAPAQPEDYGGSAGTSDRLSTADEPSSSSQASAPQASLTNKGQAINLTGPGQQMQAADGDRAVDGTNKTSAYLLPSCIGHISQVNS